MLETHCLKDTMISLTSCDVRVEFDHKNDPNDNDNDNNQRRFNEIEFINSAEFFRRNTINNKSSSKCEPIRRIYDQSSNLAPRMNLMNQDYNECTDWRHFTDEGGGNCICHTRQS